MSLGADSDPLLQGVGIVVVQALGVGDAAAGEDGHRWKEAAIFPGLRNIEITIGKHVLDTNAGKQLS